MKLTGLAAIDVAEANGLPLNKYNDPIEDARTGLDIAEARKVAAADPSLIYIVVECVGWKQAGKSIETPEGVNVADYFRYFRDGEYHGINVADHFRDGKYHGINVADFRAGEYLGADQDGVEPIFAIAADWEVAS